MLDYIPNFSVLFKNVYIWVCMWTCVWTRSFVFDLFPCAGEFGSVREAILKTDDTDIQKVAVKVLKCTWK